MPDNRQHNDSPSREPCDGPDRTGANTAGDVGRNVADLGADVTGLGAGLLGELAGSLDSLVGGLTGDKPSPGSTRRTKIHSWELPALSEDDDDDSETTDEYGEDYDRIH
jgi:hypothetical protein